MPNCYLFINEHILPRIFSSFYYDDYMAPCHNQSIFVSYQKPKKQSVTYPVEQLQNAPFLDQVHVSHIIHSMMSSLNETNTHHHSTERPSFDITLTTEVQPSIVLSRISKSKHRKRRGKCPRLLSREVRPFERFNYIDRNNSIPQSKYPASAPPIQHVPKYNPSTSPCDNEESKEANIEIKHEQEKTLKKVTGKDIHQNDQKNYINNLDDEPVNDKISHEERPQDQKKHEMKSMRPSPLSESDMTKQTNSAGPSNEDGTRDIILKEEKMKAVFHEDLLEDVKGEQLYILLEKDEVDQDITNQSSLTIDTDVIHPGNSYDDTAPFKTRVDNRPGKNINEDKNIKSTTEDPIPSAKVVKYKLNRSSVMAKKIVNEHKQNAAEFNFEILSSSPPGKEMKYKLNRTDLKTIKIVDAYKKSADETNILNLSLPTKEGNNNVDRADHLAKESASDETDTPAPTTEFHFDILQSASSIKEVKKDVKSTDISPMKVKENETKSTPSNKQVQSDTLSSKSPGSEMKYKLTRTNNQVKSSNHKQTSIVKDEVKNTQEQDFDILHTNTPPKESKLQPFHQKTNKKVSKTVSPSSNTKVKGDFHTAILNKYFTLGDKINVYAGSKLLDQQGTFLTAGPDFFIWIDGDGYVRLQIISGGISIGQTKKKK
ncbi:hypothetical protein [Rossellomorea aquimaris]|uniref:Uncharacterized protein n=1 Tax=Rossellomorea aquimaris TaxID=189382 RepID=A0A366EZR0_9BACI|nr:hypothetical protein [Rossellomorea aquimaris]RBP07834.1 hypothetical protein DET59_101202 [Rossellomorea aquimaris]